MNKLQKVISHLKNGTIFQRITDRKKIRSHKKWKNFIMGNTPFIVKEFRNGALLKLYRNGSLSETLFCYEFEDDEIDFLYLLLNSGDIVLDIGANIGLFSIHAGRIVGPAGRVFAFEPTPQTYSKLIENIELNRLKNVYANQIALSDYSGTQDFFVSEEGHDAFNSIVKPGRGEKYSVVNVNTTSLDDYVDKFDLLGKVQFVKIDVEGWEVPLFNGGRKFFLDPNAPVLMVEFTESNASNAGYSCQQLYKIIMSYGYTIYTYDSKSKSLSREPLREDYTNYLNVICIKNISSLRHKFKIK